jgi:hypothetical protein
VVMICGVEKIFISEREIYFMAAGYKKEQAL